MQSIEYPLCWVEAHMGNPGNPGHPGKLVGLEAYFGEAVPVLRTEKVPVLEKIKPGIPFKIKITYSKYVLSPEQAIMEGMARGMGYRSRERTMKIRVTIPWLKFTYSHKLDAVMAGILFYPTKRHKREREENADAYLRETSTLYSDTKEQQAANLAEYTTKVRRVLDKLYEEEKEWEPVAVRAHAGNPGNPDGTCPTLRQILTSECLKTKRVIDKELGNTWPFCDVLNEYFTKCSAVDKTSNLGIKSAKYCPSCGKLWDLSHTYCPECPTVVEGSPGTLLIRVWDYGEGYVIYPHAVSVPLEELPIE